MPHIACNVRTLFGADAKALLRPHRAARFFSPKTPLRSDAEPHRVGAARIGIS